MCWIVLFVIVVRFVVVSHFDQLVVGGGSFWPACGGGSFFCWWFVLTSFWWWFVFWWWFARSLTFCGIFLEVSRNTPPSLVNASSSSLDSDVSLSDLLIMYPGKSARYSPSKCFFPQVSVIPRILLSFLVLIASLTKPHLGVSQSSKSVR